MSKPVLTLPSFAHRTIICKRLYVYTSLKDRVLCIRYVVLILIVLRVMRKG